MIFNGLQKTGPKQKPTTGEGRLEKNTKAESSFKLYEKRFKEMVIKFKFKNSVSKKNN